MGRQELDEVLAVVRVAASAEQIASHFPAVHQGESVTVKSCAALGLC